MIYLDTGCLLKLYYPEPESGRVAALVAGEVIAFTLLHDLELANALELKVFRREATKLQVRATNTLVEEDQRAGILHRPAVGWEDVWAEACVIVKTYSRTIGCRSLDVVHCAAARHLGATSFVSTDTRQRRLARKLGLACPLV